MDTDFKVKTGGFEGPLEMLLELIEKRKLHISDISLAQVADDFINHTKSFENFPMNDSADFLLIASTLLLIKSKSLLPNLELTEEEKVSIENLEHRLELYKKYREASALIAKIFGRAPLHFREEKRSGRVVFAPTGEITLGAISQAIAEVLKNVPKTEVAPQIKVQKTISLEEMIESLRKRVETSIKMNFSNFAGKDKGDKVTVIVGFLAMLELVKQGVLRAEQEKHFDEIELETEKLNTPSYAS